MKRTMKGLVAAVAVAAVALASVVAAAPSGAQGSVRGVTDDEIVVGGLGVEQLYGVALDAAKARFDLAEKNKEIPGGRTIRSVGWADDKQTADVNTQEVRRLVDQERVFAIVPAVTPVLSGQYVNPQKVPVVGWGIAGGYCEPNNKYIFGFTGCLVPKPPKYPGNTWGSLVNEYFKAQGDQDGSKGKTAAVVTEDSDSGRSGVQTISATAEANGMDVVYAKSSLPAPPATVSDFSPYVQDIMTADNGQPPDVVFLVLTGQNVLGLGRALNQAGFRGLQTNAVAYDPRLVQIAAGATPFTQFATPESTAPAMQEIVKTLNDAGIDQISQPALAGYFAADMFVQILKKVGKNLTPERFQAVAAKFKYEIPDVVGPTYYPASFKAGAPCGQLTTSNGTSYEITAPYGCFDLLTQKKGKWVQVPYPKGVK